MLLLLLLTLPRGIFPWLPSVPLVLRRLLLLLPSLSLVLLLLLLPNLLLLLLLLPGLLDSMACVAHPLPNRLPGGELRGRRRRGQRVLVEGGQAGGGGGGGGVVWVGRLVVMVNLEKEQEHLIGR